MRKLCGISLAFFIIMMFSIQPLSAAEQERLTVMADGSGATKMEALQNAWMEAVRKAVGLFMTSKTEMIDDDITEKIVTHSRGQVNSYKVLAETQENGLWNVAIEANIDKDILQQSAAQGKSKKMTIDGTAVVAREDTAAKKKESQQKIVISALNNLELDKILRYEAELKKKMDGDKTIFYVQHSLSVDPKQFKILAEQLERTLAPVASGKETMKIEPRWGKAVSDILKNWTYSPENVDFDRFIYNLTPNYSSDPLVNVSPAANGIPKYSVCIYKNSGKMECYSFNQKFMFTVDEQVKGSYEIVFEVEDGDELSLISDSFYIKWPYIIGYPRTVMVDPTFYYQGTKDIVVLRFNQVLDLDPEQLLNLKEITGKYSITKKEHTR